MAAQTFNDAPQWEDTKSQAAYLDQKDRKNDAGYKERHFPNEQHQALLAVSQDKGIISLNDQRDDAQDRQIGQQGENLAFKNLLGGNRLARHLT